MRRRKFSPEKPKRSSSRSNRFCGLIEQAQHDPFAKGGRDDRNAHVDIPACDAQPDTAVLGQAFLRDVEPGHDFDSRGDRRLNVLGRVDDVVHHAVNPETDHQVGLERLDVNIAGAVLDRLRQESIDQLDNGRSVIGFQQVLGFLRQFAGHQVQTLLAQVDHQIVRSAGRLVVSAIDRLGDYFERRNHRLDRFAEKQAQVVQRFEIGRIGDCHGDRVTIAAQWQQGILLGVIDRDFEHQVVVDRVLVDMGLKGQAILLRQGPRQTLGLQGPHLDQRCSQFLTGLLALPGSLQILR